MFQNEPLRSLSQYYTFIITRNTEKTRQNHVQDRQNLSPYVLLLLFAIFQCTLIHV